jgi:hypothetical protein
MPLSLPGPGTSTSTGSRAFFWVRDGHSDSWYWYFKYVDFYVSVPSKTPTTTGIRLLYAKTISICKPYLFRGNIDSLVPDYRSLASDETSLVKGYLVLVAVCASRSAV